MLTRNGKAILKYMSDNGYAHGYTLKQITGADATIGILTANNRSSFYGSIYLNVGSGTTAPTKNDYALESPETGLTIVSSSSTAGQAPSYTQDYILSYTRTYKNSTASPITVSEVGLFVSYDSKYYLITRDTFTPITIQPDETYTFSVTIG